MRQSKLHMHRLRKKVFLLPQEPQNVNCMHKNTTGARCNLIVYGLRLKKLKCVFTLISSTPSSSGRSLWHPDQMNSESSGSGWVLQLSLWWVPPRTIVSWLKKTWINSAQPIEGLPEFQAFQPWISFSHPVIFIMSVRAPIKNDSQVFKINEAM